MRITKSTVQYLIKILHVLTNYMDTDEFFSFSFSNTINKGINKFLLDNVCYNGGAYNIFKIYEDGTFRIRFDRIIFNSIFTDELFLSLTKYGYSDSEINEIKINLPLQ
jgi:hypothetical protein